MVALVMASLCRRPVTARPPVVECVTATARTSRNSTRTRAGAGMIKQPDPVTWVLAAIWLGWL